MKTIHPDLNSNKLRKKNMKTHLRLFVVTGLTKLRLHFVLMAAVAAIAFSSAPSKAVILYGTDDPSINTTAPTGELAGSGWQYEGLFDGFLGTVIASNYFVTAN